MRISPAVPGKEQAKGRGKGLASLGAAGTFALAAVLYVMVSGCSKPTPDVKTLATGPMAKLITPAQPATEPDIAFKGPGGKAMKLADLKGQVVVVNFWATWCAPCKEEMPSLAKLSKDYADKGVKVVTVSQDMGQPEKVAEFFKTRGFRALEPWLDPEAELSFHYNTGTLPKLN